MATIKVILKKEKMDINGEAPLYLRIIKDRKTSFISLGYKIKEKDWNPATSSVKKSHQNSARINNYISTKIVEAQNNSLEKETESKYVPVKSIKQAILGKNSTDFFEFAEAFKENAKPKVSLGTYNRYTMVINKIKTFVDKKSLLLNEITPLFLDKFETECRDKLKNKPNTINTQFKVIRRFINQAVSDELIPSDKNPFLKRKYPYEKTNIEFLTESELATMENLEYPVNSIKFHVRNIFVFACYAGGLRVSDLLLLKWANFDGVRILLSTKKTTSILSIKLPNKALEIIHLYMPEKPNMADLVFPFLKDVDISTPEALLKAISLASSNINHTLNQIAKNEEFTKHLHMHMSRHTFATLALKTGIRIEYVSKLLGHASIKTTQIYATIVNEDLDNAMELLN
ncbi:MAG: tyrosine-type recombinase/integrase [Bacteroidales bacterium]